LNDHKHSIKSYIIAGLLVWLPIVATFLVIHFLVDLLDKTVSILPTAYQPETLFGFNLPGLGVLLSVLIVFFTGMVVTNFLGRRLFTWGEAIVERIPFVRAIYNAVKQVATTILSKDGQSFKSVYLVEYPRKGLWSIAFQTGTVDEEVEQNVGEPMIAVFIPTTPNPTSGFLIMLPKSDAQLLNMSVDQALKLVISLGVVQATTASSKKQLSKENTENGESTEKNV
jgi:uncharacterized membrane protein